MNNNLQNIKLVCFDLDGTLMDSYETIYKATIKTFELLNISGEIQHPEFHKRIGHHFADIFRELKIDIPDIEHFINIYKGIYFDFIGDTTIYDGVINFLEYLKANNIKTALLTTKAQEQAEKTLTHFNLDKYFDMITGRKIGIPVKPAPEPLLLICENLNILPSETLMVGDTELDIRCGKAAGTKTCGVTFGFRTREALVKENADFTIDHYNEFLISS